MQYLQASSSSRGMSSAVSHRSNFAFDFLTGRGLSALEDFFDGRRGILWMKVQKVCGPNQKSTFNQILHYVRKSDKNLISQE